jgi:cyclomaltodextrinase / maltogenic alpha-amylase / neopullulanase
MHKTLLSVLFLSMISSQAFSQMPPFRLSLDGEWLFRPDSQAVGVTQQWFLDSTDHAIWRPVQVPAFWETYPGMANYDGWGWFRRTVRIERTSDPLSIYFAGVDDDAVVWVNGIEVGSHTGYSDPFAVDITSAIHKGDNSVVVLVKDFSGGGGIYKPVTLIDGRRIEELLKSDYFGRPALKSADWVKDAVIYSVYLRSFSPEGTFAGLEKRLPELQDLGATVLWLLPIHPVGEKNRKGTLGSPYAVQDYYGINPEFGTLNDFRRLVAAVHRNGMKIIIDLVANHAAWDSKLIKDHPQWFVHDASGKIAPANPDWTDVAKLDYSRPELRHYMIEMMCWWVRDVGIDGFRCDVAELVPTSFWNEARARLNRIKPVMMLSEGSIPEHHIAAFDLTYSWNIYDQLLPILSGKRPVTTLDQLLRNEYLSFPTGSLRLRFVTNHDKNAWDAPAVEKFGPGGLKVATVLVNTLPGVPLIYSGEEVANDRRLSLFEKVGVDWRRPRDMGKLIQTLDRLRREHKAISRGELIRVPSDNDTQVYSFFRSAGSDRVFVVLNLAAGPVTAKLTVPTGRLFPRKLKVALKELFSGKTAMLESVDENAEMSVELEGYGYRVYTVK